MNIRQSEGLGAIGSNFQRLPVVDIAVMMEIVLGHVGPEVNRNEGEIG